MEVTALCITLFMNVLLLLEALGYQHHALKDDGAILNVFPSRQQFFEYESISFTCGEFNVSAEWNVVRNTEEFIPVCTNSTVTPTVTCTVYNVFEADSGVYWCESGQKERSNTVNITVTGGSVILESPPLPVMEGETIILHCREKASLLNHNVYLYKDGRLIYTTYTGKIIIHNVSRSDEGVYKCRISDVGESPESWLKISLTKQHKEAVAVILETPVLPITEGESATLHCRIKSSSNNFPAVFYKDGMFIGTSFTGNMSISHVYKSHEGLYMCRISSAGESPQSWLLVRAFHTETSPCSDHLSYVLLLIRAVSTVVMLPLLLLVVLLFHCGKLGGHQKVVLIEKSLQQQNTEEILEEHNIC